mmetsp:Transcript_7179/g.10479  ORF Transcript_7179/g.10479 Transcript_7179/m.10479 type:complete len:1368 (-) Transcript_7179:1444-5547(-)
MTSEFQVNDPVTVSRESKQLEGVVAYVGPVQFAEGDDWVGVQLTGISVGLGKNDGAVQGEQYFSCGPNSGVFVRNNNVTRRKLSRLEELRLKRELTLSSRATTSKSPATRTRTRTPQRESATKSSNTSSIKKVPSSSKIPRVPSAKSRLDELRERRGAQGNRSRPTTPVARNLAKAGYDQAEQQEAEDIEKDLSQQQQQLKEMEKKIESLQSSLTEVSAKLKSKEKENASLHESLSRADQGVHEYKSQVEELEALSKSKGKETVIQISSDKMHEQLETLQADYSTMKANNSNFQDTIDKLQEELEKAEGDVKREREIREAEAQELQDVKANFLSVQHELDALSHQADSRTSSDASHYKEKAKLQAELGAVKRLNEQLESEKLDLESTLEDLTLDKEQLAEEKEELEDRIEELKLDAETAQYEVEELRLELETAKGLGEEGQAMNADDDDAIQTLATQNSRLREALIRLREQASFESMELSRQLRAAEKEQAENTDLKKEVLALRTTKVSLEEQLGFLKETVDQCSAFEGMVEDLSDRIMILEDENVTLLSTVREMEDAADIAAELEEVQAEELKALMSDLEERDSIVRNLEEAVKMQRRREEDFQRTVINYRNSVETMKQEKNELLNLQRGGEGEKSEIIATSQKALSRAAMLVSDAANARRKEAEYVFKRVEGDVQRHLSERLESMLPHSVVSTELSAIKGELLLCKVVGKAAMTLDGLSTSFTKSIRAGMNEVITAEDSQSDLSGVIKVSDETSQLVDRFIHEMKFSMSTIEMSSELIRLLAAGQWPDLLSVEESAELGSTFLHSLSDLDVSIGDTLKILKEEEVLSPHRSNLGAFRQSFDTTLKSLKNVRSFEDKPLIPDEWKPLAWKLFKNIGLAKFCCIGSAATIAAVLKSEEASESTAFTMSAFKNLMTKMEKLTGEAMKIGPRMYHLEVTNEKIVNELENAASAWNNAAQGVATSVTSLFSTKGEIELEKVKACESASDSALKAISLLGSTLRAADLNAEDGVTEQHALSVENQNPWLGISSLSQSIRAIDGDEDEVNFWIRTSVIENRLASAIEDVPKLMSANTKISTLEKTLGSRSKELAIQNARLSELEKLLSKQTSTPSQTRVQSSASVTEELMRLKEENRVLTDAMDVLQQQVDEYEYEIRSLRDPKTPGRNRQATPRKAATPRNNILRTPSKSSAAGIAEDAGSAAGVIALQAALFRPAIESIRHEASIWKTSVVAKNILTLPPLSVNGLNSMKSEDSKDEKEHNYDLFSALESARGKVRVEKASFALVDLKSKTPSRIQLLKSLSRTSIAEEKLKQVTAAASGALVEQGISTGIAKQGSLLGRVRFSGDGTCQPVPVVVTKEDIRRLHLHMIK